MNSSSDATSGPLLEIFTLGGVRIQRLGEPMTGLTTKKAEAMLIYLAATRRAQPREVLAELLWDERSQSQAMANLRGVLTTLRQELGEFLIITRDTAGILPKAEVWLDASALEDSLAKIQKQSPLHPDSAAQLAKSLEMYQGEFLEGFSVFDCRGFEEWSTRERERLHQLAIDGLSILANYELEQKEYPQGMAYTRHILDLDPLNENAHRQMMQLLAGSGQRAAALSQYDTCQKLLKAELGIEPEPETRRLYEQLRAGTLISPPRTSEQPAKRPHLPRHNLPVQLTSFIGRVDEMREIRQLLSTTHLLTLTGTGGTGKTRLALQVAADLVDEYPHGVWLVELSTFRESSEVASAVAAVLGMNEQPGRPIIEVLVNYLKDKQILILLDNCEHLVEACARLADLLLRSCPKLKILATSRIRLHVAGEMIFQVTPLSVPDPEQAEELSSLSKYEAVQLFVERATAVQPFFKLKTDNAAAVRQICCHLDGIPLAIELAAARVRHVSTGQIANRLAERFGLLTNGNFTNLPHQQTLIATLEWSYNLLHENERTLFRRLPVFVGGFSLASVEIVCSDDYVLDSKNSLIKSEQILDILGSLVDHSLVTVKEYENENRYFMLETVGQFARDKLTASGELHRLKDRHLAYFLRFADEGLSASEAGDRAGIAKLINEYENFRIAMEYALSNNLETAIILLRLMVSFCEVDVRRCRDAYNWGIQLYKLTENWPSISFRAMAAWLAGDLAVQIREYRQAEEFLEISIGIAKEINDKYMLMFSYQSFAQMNFHRYEWSQMHRYVELFLPIACELNHEYIEIYGYLYLGIAIAMEGDLQTGHSYLERVYQRAIKENIPYFIYHSRLAMAETEQLFGDIDKAIAQFYDLIAFCRRDGAYQALIDLIYHLGLAWIKKGDAVQAKAHFGECLAVYYEQIHRANFNGEILYLFGMAGLAGYLQQDKTAAMLFGAYEIELERLTLPFRMRMVNIIVNPILDMVKERLGEMEYSSLLEEGRKLSIKQALELARQV